MAPAAQETLETCRHMISPGFLKRCRIYARNDDVAPEKCFDESAGMVPIGMGQHCPNHTGRRRQGPYPQAWEDELATLKQRYYAKVRTWASTPPEGEKVPEPEIEPEDPAPEGEANP